MAKLTVNLPSVAEGELVEVPGFGVFENGSSTEVESLESDLTIPATTEELKLPTDEELAEHTVDELREIAKDKGLTGYSSLNKEELVDEIAHGDPEGAE